MDDEQRQFQPVGFSDLVIDIPEIILDDLLGRAQPAWRSL
jgi:hypothetical protein